MLDWIKARLTGVLLVALVLMGAFAGVQSMRLLETEADLAKAQASFATQIAASEAARAATITEYRNREQAMAEASSKIKESDNEKIASLSAVNSSLLERLRARQARPQARPSAPAESPSPERSGNPQGAAGLPSSGGPVSAGEASAIATGADLYREDAIWLAGEARRADQVVVALQSCQAQYAIVQSTINRQ